MLKIRSVPPTENNDYKLESADYEDKNASEMKQNLQASQEKWTQLQEILHLVK